ncbi:MAG TPA: amidohydrolase family protein [Aeromicrobium sp.]|nr:amidohydrolase family protein [Aeromicrobium sp.]
MTIDVWMQHPTPRFSQHEMFDSLRRWTGQPAVTDDLPLEFTTACLDEADIGMGLLSAWHSPREGALISNDDVAGWVAAQPDRFRGIAAVDLHDPVRAVRELRRRVRDDGFVGLRVVPWLWGLPPTDALYYPLFAECVELGVPFCTQVGHTGPLRPSETGRPIPYIDQIALHFPDLAIVCGHIGYPWTLEMIAVADKHPNVFIDTSAYTVQRYPAELIDYLRGRGRTKVMFGTNYPMITHAQALEHLGSLELDEVTLDAFLEGNARRVFALER